MTKIYYEKDADLALLKDKTIAIIGYGSQGHAHAQNLRDSGCKVIVGQRPGSANYDLAKSHGFEPVSAEEAAKQGDLDLRFTPSPTAQDGILGHKLVASRRPAGYESEIALTGRWKQLPVRGRADGFDPVRNRLEEIKTHRGDLASMKANHRALHWAQARIYGWLLCEARGLAAHGIVDEHHLLGQPREPSIELELLGGPDRGAQRGELA